MAVLRNDLAHHFARDVAQAEVATAEPISQFRVVDADQVQDRGVLFLSAVATNWIGIFSIFGPFLLGTMLSGEHQFRTAVNGQLRNFVTVFFLSIFFTYTGLSTDIGTLETLELWLFAAVVSLAAIVGKFGGCTLAGWLGGFPGREVASIGIMMNTRGLMELIVINVGYELG